jgi:hypothetical protein
MLPMKEGMLLHSLNQVFFITSFNLPLGGDRRRSHCENQQSAIAKHVESLLLTSLRLFSLSLTDINTDIQQHALNLGVSLRRKFCGIYIDMLPMTV